MEDKTIILLNYGHFETDMLQSIAADISKIFLHPVSIKDSSIELTHYYDAARRQYDGNQLLKEVDSLIFQDAQKKMGLFRVDLFIPILTYIFGQAVYNGNSGIASLYRLKNEQYGMEPNESLLLERFRKVIIHELGHTFGLIHCHYPSCVMRSSTYVEDIDQKSHLLCNNCRKEIQNNI